MFTVEYYVFVIISKIKYKIMYDLLIILRVKEK